MVFSIISTYFNIYGLKYIFYNFMVIYDILIKIYTEKKRGLIAAPHTIYQNVKLNCRYRQSGIG